MSKAKNVEIFYDSREHNPALMKIRQAGFKPIQKMLPVGDYHIKGDNDQEVFIELKIGRDFYQSIFSQKHKKKKRLKPQIANLMQKDFGVVVFVGEDFFDDEYVQFVPDRFSAHYPTSNVNLLASLFRKTENKNTVLFFQLPTIREFQDLVIYYARKIKKGELYQSDIPGNALRIMDEDVGIPDDWDEIKSRQVAMLMKIGNVGFDKAVLIHKHFDGDMGKIFTAKDDDLLAIRGIGKKVVEGFRELGIVCLMRTPLCSDSHLETDLYPNDETYKAGMEIMYGTSETDVEMEAREPKKKED
ncbi:MAG: hypothetical protein KJI71_01370 [Patescibacteria group bacterium]|nr:hypothetical protein [Patescibacteria group bacterium]